MSGGLGVFRCLVLCSWVVFGWSFYLERRSGGSLSWCASLALISVMFHVRQFSLKWRFWCCLRRLAKVSSLVAGLVLLACWSIWVLDYPPELVLWVTTLIELWWFHSSEMLEAVVFFCFLVGWWLCSSLGLLIVNGVFVWKLLVSFHFVLALLLVFCCSFILLSLFSSWCSSPVGVVEPF